MARRVFFSFHYQRDIWRVSQVRNHWLTKPDRESAGYVDAAEWEKIKNTGKKAIQDWIDKQLQGTSVTVVLIGYETSGREYVNYEIKKSYEKGNGLFGVYIHKLRDRDGRTDPKGKNPFDNFTLERDGKKVLISKIYPTYDWVNNDGYNNFAQWVENAARQVRR